MPITLYEATQLAGTLGIGWIIYLVSKSLPAYLAEKGKNLATKEDIDHLTEKVERIRSQFSQVNTVHKVQFEVEFKSYQDLWTAAHVAEVSHIRCRSIIMDSPDEAKLEFGSSQLAFSQMLIRCEPFVPHSAWLTFKAFDDLLIDAKIDLINDPTKTSADLLADRKAMRSAACLCVESIKSRLSEVLVVR